MPPAGTIIPVICQAGHKGRTGHGGNGFFEPSARHGSYSRVRPAAGPMPLAPDGKTEVLLLNTGDTSQVLRRESFLGRWYAIEPDKLMTKTDEKCGDHQVDPLFSFTCLSDPKDTEDEVVFEILSFRAEKSPPIATPEDPPPPPKPPEPPPGNDDDESFEWPHQPEAPSSSLGPSDADTGPEDLNRILTMSPEELKQEQLKVVEEQVNLATPVLADTEREIIRNVCKEFYMAWAVDNLNPHRTNLIEFTIPTGNAKPIQSRPFRVSVKENIYIAEQVKLMLRNGIIRRSTSAWSSPVVLAPKPDGSLRFCVDYRRLNSILPDDRRPLPLIQDILDGLQGAKYFTSLDLASAYWSVPIKESDKEKTAFITQGGLFEFNVLPFGVKTAPATFQFLMQRVLAGHPSAQPYLDDISIVSKTFEEHVQHLREVFERLTKAGLTLKASKCHFCPAEMPYLGHLAGPNGVRPNPDKIKAVKEMPTPSKKRDLRAFLGLAQYYRRFVLGFSHVAAPLYGLLKLHASFDWEDCHEQAFNSLKEALVSSPVLAYPDPNKPFTLYTDASDVGVGAILAQEQDGVEKVVQYLSRKLDGAERRYAASEKECLGVVWAIEKCRPYIWGNHFTVVTDCSALKYLMTTASPNGRLIRWAMRLSEYSFTVKYRKGSTNENADALSRIFADAPLEQRYSSQVVGGSEAPAPITVVDVDEGGECDAIKRMCKQHLMPKVQVMEGNHSANHTWKDDEGSEYVISAMMDEERDDEWDLLTTTVDETSSPTEDEPWLDEDLDDRIDVEEHDHDEDETVYVKDEILEHLKEEQAEDKDFCAVILDGLKKLEEKPEDPKLLELTRGYKLDGSGRLTYRSPSGRIDRLAIPESLRKILLYELHSSPHGGHMGQNRTRGNMTCRYYWPGMTYDIDEWIGTCAACNRRKPSPYGKVGQLYPLSAKEPFAMWGMDLLELPLSINKNKYLLVMTDYFTRWVEAIPLPNKEAVTVAGVIYREIFCRYGAPESILTDQGKEFNNELLKTLCLAYGVKKLLATVKKSSTNGLTERFNRTLWDMLSKKGIDQHNKWDQHINACLYAYRSQKQASTGKSPYELLFGQQMKLPVDIALNGQQSARVQDKFRILQQDLGVGYEGLEAQALQQARERTRKFLQEQAAQQLTLKQQAQKERWDKKARELDVQVGARVHIKTCRDQAGALAKKARLDWQGPYVVLDLLPRGNLLVKKEHPPNSAPEVWHITNTKPAWDRPRRTPKPLKVNHLLVAAMERLPGTIEVPLLCYRFGPAKQSTIPMDVEQDD